MHHGIRLIEETQEVAELTSEAIAEQSTEPEKNATEISIIHHSSNKTAELRAKRNEETPEAREVRLSAVRERYAERKRKKPKKKISMISLNRLNDNVKYVNRKRRKGEKKDAELTKNTTRFNVQQNKSKLIMREDA